MAANQFHYDAVGNRRFTRDHLRASQGELYVHDPCDRLRRMQRGELESQNEYVAAIPARRDAGVQPW